ncbi:MAG TPA: hypothetical protein VJ717_01280 [Gemmatimonadaceae bacterium]|nr:hypothetical protein [Gemmatimonadaceae bacterium]
MFARATSFSVQPTFWCHDHDVPERITQFVHDHIGHAGGKLRAIEVDSDSFYLVGNFPGLTSKAQRVKRGLWSEIP